MATISANKPPTGAVRKGFMPSFPLWMVLAMCFFVFAGFGMSYLYPTAIGARSGDPPIVHLHGLAYFAWMILLLVQALLVNVKKVKLHSSLGTFGIAVATLVVFMGAVITIIAASGELGKMAMVDHDTAGVFYLSVVAPPSFALLFAMAIRAVRKPADHRSLILLATISVLMPGINRTYSYGLGVAGTPFLATYMTMNAILAAILWHHWRANGSISRNVWIGAAIIVLPQPFISLVSSSDAFADFIQYLGSLVYYR